MTPAVATRAIAPPTTAAGKRELDGASDFADAVEGDARGRRAHRTDASASADTGEKRPQERTTLGKDGPLAMVAHGPTVRRDGMIARVPDATDDEDTGDTTALPLQPQDGETDQAGVIAPNTVISSSLASTVAKVGWGGDGEGLARVREIGTAGGRSTDHSVSASNGKATASIMAGQASDRSGPAPSALSPVVGERTFAMPDEGRGSHIGASVSRTTGVVARALDVDAAAGDGATARGAIPSTVLLPRTTVPPPSGLGWSSEAALRDAIARHALAPPAMPLSAPIAVGAGPDLSAQPSTHGPASIVRIVTGLPPTAPSEPVLLHLRPAELGAVEVEIARRAGGLVIELRVETPEALRAMEAERGALEDMLRRDGARDGGREANVSIALRDGSGNARGTAADDGDAQHDDGGADWAMDEAGSHRPLRTI